MGQGALNYQGIKSGIKLNDVIEEFKYVYQGKTITAGDFVNYINGISGETTTTKTGTSVEQALDGESMYSGYDSICAKELSDNRVIVVHSYTADYDLYAMVVTIDGATIIPSTDTQLINYDFAGRYLSVEVLPNGNVFIAHDYSTSHYLYGIVCTIDGTTITKGTNTALYANSTSGYGVSTCLLPDGKVFVAHSYNSNYTVAGVVVTINGTTITKGTDTQLTTLTSGYFSSSTVLLDNGMIFIAHSYDTDRKLCATICTVSGTAITLKNTIVISSTGGTGAFVSASLLKDGNVFIGFVNGTQYHRALAVVCAPNSAGTSLTKGSMITLSSDNNSGKGISTTVLPSGKVFVSHGTDGTNMNLTGTICTISGTTITNGTATRLNTKIRTSATTSAVALKNGNVFIAHSYSNSYYLYAQMFGIDETNNIPTTQVTVTETVPVYEQQVTLATQPPFDGIALSNGVGGTSTAHNEQVKIARLKPINLVVNGDFSNGLDGWVDLNPRSVTWSTNDNGLTFISGGEWSGIKTGKEQIIKSQIPAGHIFYASMVINGQLSSGHSVVLAVSNGSNAHSINVTNISNIQSKMSMRISSTVLYDRLEIWVRSVKNGDTATITDIKCYDLTAMYGAGNEPTKEWCDNNL